MISEGEAVISNIDDEISRLLGKYTTLLRT
jgi:hypothetical protein